MRVKTNNRILAVVGGILVVILTHLLAADLDPMEQWHRFAGAHENWELDEVPVIAVSLVIYVFALLFGQVRINQNLIAQLKTENQTAWRLNTNCARHWPPATDFRGHEP